MRSVKLLLLVVGLSFWPVRALAQDSKAPIPQEPALGELRARVRELFKFKKAKTAADKSAIAEKLVDAEDELLDTGERYAVLLEAYDLWKECHSLDRALAVVQVIERHYAPFDALSFQVAAMVECAADKEIPADEFRGLAGQALDLAERCSAEQKFDLAKRLLSAIRAGLHQPGNEALEERSKALNEEIKGLEKYQADSEKLKTAPEDPAANQSVGEVLLRRGDIDAALSCLSRGTGKLAELARLDLAGATTPQGWIQLGNAWYDGASRLTDAGLRSRARERAGDCYGRALPDLDVGGDTADALHEFVAARLTLESNPADPKASLAAGQFLFAHGRLQEGFALLVKGTAGPLADCAQLELASPVEPEQQNALAVRWFDYLARDKPRGRLQFEAQKRALHWCDVAKAGLTDLEARVADEALLEAKRRAFRRREDGMDSATRSSVDKALDWLQSHQEKAGSWTCEPNANDTVGVTGLALLALLADGNTLEGGYYRDELERGVRWLCSHQSESGLIGERRSQHFLYDHAIATLALCETCRTAAELSLQGAAKKAIGFALRARNPYMGWRYSEPPDGDNDSSITGWMVLALSSARNAGFEAGLEKEYQDAFSGALALVDTLTEPASGRVGYTSMGQCSARPSDLVERFPADYGEALTAVGLRCRLLCGQKPTDEMLGRHARLIRKKLPVWDPQGSRNDLYFWFHASHAMAAMGREYEQVWDEALLAALVKSQCRTGGDSGSWDPSLDPWGISAGRVYSTAMAAMSLVVATTKR